MRNYLLKARYGCFIIVMKICSMRTRLNKIAIHPRSWLFQSFEIFMEAFVAVTSSKFCSLGVTAMGSFKTFFVSLYRRLTIPSFIVIPRSIRLRRGCTIVQWKLQEFTAWYLSNNKCDFIGRLYFHFCMKAKVGFKDCRRSPILILLGYGFTLGMCWNLKMKVI